MTTLPSSTTERSNEAQKYAGCIRVHNASPTSTDPNFVKDVLATRDRLCESPRKSTIETQRRETQSGTYDSAAASATKARSEASLYAQELDKLRERRSNRLFWLACKHGFVQNGSEADRKEVIQVTDGVMTMAENEIMRKAYEAMKSMFEEDTILAEIETEIDELKAAEEAALKLKKNSDFLHKTDDDRTSKSTAAVSSTPLPSKPNDTGAMSTTPANPKPFTFTHSFPSRPMISDSPPTEYYHPDLSLSNSFYNPALARFSPSAASLRAMCEPFASNNPNSRNSRVFSAHQPVLGSGPIRALANTPINSPVASIHRPAPTRAPTNTPVSSAMPTASTTPAGLLTRAGSPFYNTPPYFEPSPCLSTTADNNNNNNTTTTTNTKTTPNAPAGLASSSALSWGESARLALRAWLVRLPPSSVLENSADDADQNEDWIHVPKDGPDDDVELGSDGLSPAVNATFLDSEDEVDFWRLVVDAKGKGKGGRD